VKTIFFAILFTAASCAKPAGGPLAYTFDNTKIAQVDLAAKDSVTQAQQASDLAQLEHTRARDLYNDSEVEQEVAEYQAEHAVLVSQLVAAKLNQGGSQSAETAALARKSAEAKVDFARARRSWLGKLEASSFYVVYATQAKLELERAKVAQSHNLAPAGFDIGVYERQAEARDRAAKDARASTDQERGATEAKLTSWSTAEHAFMQASNLTGPAESDRAVKNWKVDTAPSVTEPAAPPAATPATTPEPAPTTPAMVPTT
jgi:hypothetical protein